MKKNYSGIFSYIMQVIESKEADNYVLSNVF